MAHTRRVAYLAAFVTCIAELLCSSAASAGAAPTKAQQDTWRAAITQTPRPNSGCLQARFPATTWQLVPCGPAEPVSTAPAKHVFRPLDENSSGNQTALSSGIISTATGSFDQIANVTQAAGFGFTNSFTIQMNTNGFASPLCKKTHNAGCVGSEQFVVDSGGGTNIQVWLNSYLDSVTTTCPDKTWNTSGNACWKRGVTSNSNVNLPVHTFNQLQGITLTATAAANGQDSFTVTGPSLGTTITLPAGLGFGLAGRWKLVDFNVYGESSNEVIFNPGAVMSVYVAVTDGAPNPPTCSGQGLGGVKTVETSNLTLGRCVSSQGFGSSLAHGITFYEGVPATVSGINPSTGVAAGGTPVTITGAGLSKNLSVKFGTTYANRVLNCNGATSCTAISPPGAGPVDVTVVNLSSIGGEGIFSATTPTDRFTYTPLPTPPHR